MKGFTLDILNDTLGRTKEICSILEPDSDEKTLLASIVGDDVDERMGYIDIVVDSWREPLIEQKKKIWWNDMYKKDVASRNKKAALKENVSTNKKFSGGITDLKELKEVIEKGFQRLVDQVGEIDVKVDARFSEIDHKVVALHEVVLAHAKDFSEVSEEHEKTAGKSKKETSTKKNREGKQKETEKEKSTKKKKEGKEKEKENEKEKDKSMERQRKGKEDEKEKNKKKRNAEIKSGLLTRTWEKRLSIPPNKYTPAGKSSK